MVEPRVVNVFGSRVCFWAVGYLTNPPTQRSHKTRCPPELPPSPLVFLTSFSERTSSLSFVASSFTQKKKASLQPRGSSGVEKEIRCERTREKKEKGITLQMENKTTSTINHKPPLKRSYWAKKRKRNVWLQALRTSPPSRSIYCFAYFLSEKKSCFLICLWSVGSLIRCLPFLGVPSFFNFELSAWGIFLKAILPPAPWPHATQRLFMSSSSRLPLKCIFLLNLSLFSTLISFNTNVEVCCKIWHWVKKKRKRLGHGSTPGRILHQAWIFDYCNLNSYAFLTSTPTKSLKWRVFMSRPG